MATKGKTTTKKVKKALSEKSIIKKEKVKRVVSKRAVVKRGQKKNPKYWEAVGKRKTAIARVRLWDTGKQEIIVNDKKIEEYLRKPALSEIALAPLRAVDLISRFRVSIKVRGGGISGQSEAIRHGIARALIKFEPLLRKDMRRVGFLTRDPRAKERKKPGLKRARRAPQWQKR